MICISELAQQRMLPLSLEAGEALGAGSLFILIAIAVVLFVTSHLTMNQFQYLRKEELELLYGVEGIVEKKKQEFSPHLHQEKIKVSNYALDKA